MIQGRRPFRCSYHLYIAWSIRTMAARHPLELRTTTVSITDKTTILVAFDQDAETRTDQFEQTARAILEALLLLKLTIRDIRSVRTLDGRCPNPHYHLVFLNQIVCLTVRGRTGDCCTVHIPMPSGSLPWKHWFYHPLRWALCYQEKLKPDKLLSLRMPAPLKFDVCVQAEGAEKPMTTWARDLPQLDTDTHEGRCVSRTRHGRHCIRQKASTICGTSCR
jgi:hypothetical protein